MILLGIYLIGFIITLLFLYREELTRHDGIEFGWCWVASLLWIGFWPVCGVLFVVEQLEENKLNPLQSFHAYLRERYGRSND